jgi:hypothetical protein
MKEEGDADVAAGGRLLGGGSVAVAPRLSCAARFALRMKPSRRSRARDWTRRRKPRPLVCLTQQWIENRQGFLNDEPRQASVKT